jgi:hypothetical protein
MTILTRLASASALILSFESGYAQQTKPHLVRQGFWDRVGLITESWWIATFVATCLLGLLVGYFVYRGAVSNGRAGAATGSGCLTAVLVFLGAQLVAVIVLMSTVFSNSTAYAADSTNADTKSSATTPKQAEGATSTSSPGQTAPKGGEKTSGDDF